MSENNGQLNNSQYDALARFMGLTSDSDAELLKELKEFRREFRRSSDSKPRMPSMGVFKDRQSQRDGMRFEENSIRRSSRNYRRSGSIVGDIEQGIADSLMASFKKSDFGKGVQGALDQFTKQFGFELKDLPHEYGKHLGDKLFKSLSKSKFGQNLSDRLTKDAASLLDRYIGKGVGSSAAGAIKSYAGSSAAGAAGAGAAGSKLAGGALTQALDKEALMKSIDKLGAKFGGIAAVAYIAYKLVKPFLTAVTDIAKSWGKALSRDEDMRRKRLENGQKRLQADMESLARLPFQILEEAAKEWQDTWDKNLAKVSLTQGYDKENTYALYSSIAERLNKEALGNVIPATEVINNLGQILDSGLSGKVAEEFAYQATKLNAEIPTENFINYASTYAQIAAEQINAGKSQQEALNYATQQLQLFASNLLTASRDLAGGFTTGLKDASSLFQSATEIVQTARKGDVATVSGTLTSISAMVGTIAPDLASGLVNNVVQAAIGGNSDTIVALRSLAGINAGNTAFLQKLAEDPQGLFVSIFQGLGNLQNMSPANYMEVAEGLSSVFGVDMKALARVDFNNLATQISQMQVNDSSLRENVKLLVTEQATTTAAQARYQEINQQILNDGLAYVIDSEYGRMVQQHMWEEQLANELESTTYSVEIQGAALSLFEGIRHAVANIINFLNPIGWLSSKVAQLEATKDEAAVFDYNIAKMLEYNKVGGGNAKAWNNLLNYGQDLKLVETIKDNLGLSKSTYNLSSIGISGYDWNKEVDAVGGLNPVRVANVSNTTDKAISMYSGFLNASVGKSALGLTSGSPTSLAAITRAALGNTTQNANNESNRRMQAFLNSAQQAVGKYDKETGKIVGGMTYEQWKATAASKYGIANYNEALGIYGKSEEDIRAYFESLQGQLGATREEDRKNDEVKFREDVRTFWAFKDGTYQSIIWGPFITDYINPFFTPGSGRYDVTMNLVNTSLANIQDKQDTIISQLGTAKDYTVIGGISTIINQIQTTFVATNSFFQRSLAGWLAYISSKTAYRDSLVADNIRAWSDMAKAKDDEGKQASLALANALNEFTADQIKNLDPQLQANVLLGKIVIILEAIMQQNNTVGGGLSLIDTISALSVGKTK